MEAATLPTRQPVRPTRQDVLRGGNRGSERGGSGGGIVAASVATAGAEVAEARTARAATARSVVRMAARATAVAAGGRVLAAQISVI